MRCFWSLISLLAAFTLTTATPDEWISDLILRDVASAASSSPESVADAQAKQAEQVKLLMSMPKCGVRILPILDETIITSL
jgi:hypothetical protein